MKRERSARLLTGVGRRRQPSHRGARKRHPVHAGPKWEPERPPEVEALADTYRAKLAELVPGDKLGRNYAEAIADAAFAAGLRGNIGAFQEIADRAEGKPAHAIALSGDVHLTMTVQEIDARLNELLKTAREREKARITFGKSRHASVIVQ